MKKWSVLSGSSVLPGIMRALSGLFLRAFALFLTLLYTSAAWAICSAEFHGLATINEVHQLSQGKKNDRYIEIKILSSGITDTEYDSWTLTPCASETCTGGDIAVSSMDDSTYPWITADETNIASENFIDLSDGMDVILKDGNGDTIDYLSVESFNRQEDSNCTPAFDWKADGSNTKTLARSPDGTGEWFGASGNSGDTTEGGSNDGNGSCDWTSKDVGFVFYLMDGQEGLPDLRSGLEGEFKMKALEKDDQSGQCTAVLKDQTKNISFHTSYINPELAGSVEKRDYTVINGVEVSRDESAWTDVPVTFDENGFAELTIRYDDAGRNKLWAWYVEEDSPDGGVLTIEGESEFTSVPYGLCLLPEKQCSSADMSCTETHIAGTELTVTPKAYRWSTDVDSLICSDKLPTPSFALSGMDVLHDVRLPDPTTPTGGIEGNDLGAINFGEGDQKLTFTEVGVFEAYTGTIPGGYLGLDVPASDKMMTPRFIPEKLEFLTSTPEPLEFHSECGGFVYLEQPFGWDDESLPILEFEALNAQGDLTKNYTRPVVLDSVLVSEDFLFATPTGTEQVGSWVDDGEVVLEKASSLDSSFYSGTVSGGVPGIVEYKFSEDDTFVFAKDSVLEPFNPDMLLSLLAMTDKDGVPVTPSDLTISASGGVELRYGRLVMENVYGPETEGTMLTMPFLVEYFEGGRFKRNVLDDNGLDANSGCTVWNADNVAAVDSTAGSPPNYIMNTSGEGDFAEGKAELELEAAGTRATDTLEWDLFGKPWLQHYWGREPEDPDDPGADDLQNPRATATFGVYRGNDRIIYWQEVLN